eukprot:gb/GECG01008545.1/.p1 GENE.gb/GECG01008545.1/~~gb/GECG01008545.1/.p1  ORF type:complete len:125 (+),score=16.88 gb/GECG01008545.1/:1-375(+)
MSIGLDYGRRPGSNGLSRWTFGCSLMMAACFLYGMVSSSRKHAQNATTPATGASEEGRNTFVQLLVDPLRDLWNHRNRPDPSAALDNPPSNQGKREKHAQELSKRLEQQAAAKETASANQEEER